MKCRRQRHRVIKGVDYVMRRIARGRSTPSVGVENVHLASLQLNLKIAD